jgi:hypothetical protein
LPQDGIPLLDPAAFRRYLRALPKGTVMSGDSPLHPVAKWLGVLTGKQFLFWQDTALNYWYATCKLPDPHPTEVAPEDFIFTMPPRLIPEPMITLLVRLLRYKRPVTRERVLEELQLAECIVHDMHAMAQTFLNEGGNRGHNWSLEDDDEVDV